MSIHEEWQALRPQIGAFVNKLDNTCKGAEDLDNTIEQAKKIGYEAGFKADKKALCDTCAEHEFYKMCNGYILPIKKYMKLSPQSRHVVSEVIEQLSNTEQPIELDK